MKSLLLNSRASARPAAACRALGITREAFEAQAEQMHCSFSAEELDAIFPDGTDTAEAS